MPDCAGLEVIGFALVAINLGLFALLFRNNV